MVAPEPHIYRPVPRVGVGIGLCVLAVVGLPGLILQPTIEAIIAALVCGALAFGLVLLARVHYVLSFDPEWQVLRILAVRWPLPPREQEVPAASVLAVEVRQMHRSGVLNLTLEGGIDLPVAGGATSNWAAHQAAAATLRGWLGR